MEVTIGFMNTFYMVNESDGLINIQIGVTNNGSLQTSVPVNFFISQNQSVTNRGKYHYKNGIHQITLSNCIL